MVAVIAYHFRLAGFAGGFVGVDIFFVISGFLMTSIIVKGLERGRFSSLDFYVSRARRIVPALLATCLCLLVLGWRFLMPSDYRVLANHVISSLGFFSNIKYWDEAGYFDAASHEKWLLHTWSLSVEWQFYIILPLILIAIWRIVPGRPFQGFSILLLMLLSLTASVALVDRYPEATFYWLPMRAWEMLGGGLLFVTGTTAKPSAAQRRALEYAGLLLVVASIALFDATSPWPGWRALVPVTGTVLILTANRNSVWTGSRAAQWLGDRSYSLYLWHWPVYVVLKYLQFDLRVEGILAGLAITLLLGHCSYHWLETPSRRALERLAAPRGAIALAGAAAIGLVLALGIRSADGIVGRFSTEVEQVAAEAFNVNPDRGKCHIGRGNAFPSCMYGGNQLGLVLVGDSHADAIVTALAAAVPDPHQGLMQWTYNGCPPVSGLQPLPHKIKRLGGNAWRCLEFIDWMLAHLAELPPGVPVVLVARYAAIGLGLNEEAGAAGKPDWYASQVFSSVTPTMLDEFSARITRSACDLAQQRPVYMVRPIPEMGFNVPQTLSRRMAMGFKSDLSIPLEAYQKRNSWIWAAQDKARDECNVMIIDPTATLCDESHCYGSLKGRPLYSDDNHLSEYGNKVLIPIFRSVLQPH